MVKKRIRTAEQWRNYCLNEITGGYVAGATADKYKFYDTGVSMLRTIQSDGVVFNEDSKILDIGCGNARVPMVLDGEQIIHKTYYGIDVIPQSIQYAKKAFSSQSNTYRFERWDVQNDRYNQVGKQVAAQQKFPHDYNVILANSLFTHLGEIKHAVDYLNLMVANLDDYGQVYSTWLRSPPNVLSNDDARTVYNEGDIYRIIADAGLTIEGEFGGETISSPSNPDQWRILARKIPA